MRTMFRAAAAIAITLSFAPARAETVSPGGGATPGGSSGQLQFNNAGVFGGGAGTAWDDTNRTLTITGATVTTSKPLLDLSQTWNTGANVPTAIKLNVTDTVSPAGSLLMDLQVGGSSIFSVRKDGVISSSLGGGLTFNSSGGYTNLSVTNSGFTVLSTLGIGANDAAVSRLGAASLAIGNGTAGDTSGKLTLGSLYFDGTTGSIHVNGSLRADYGATTGSVWTLQGPTAFSSDSMYYSLGAALDVRLARDAANTLALRNGANANKFNVYNTYTDASNYERASFSWGSNIFTISTGKAGTGTGRVLALQSSDANSQISFLNNAGSAVWFLYNGNWLAATDASYNIGAVGANRPNNIYMAGNLNSAGNAYMTSFQAASGGAIQWTSRAVMASPADAQIAMTNWAANAGGLIDVSTDASFKFRNRANNADASITAASITTSSTTLHTTSVALTNGAGANTATLTNGPTAGNPTKWIPINDNGTTRYIPAW